MARFETVEINSCEPPLCWQAMYSSVCLEQQPRVRGWLLASVDGQTSGLVPANYVKVLGKRRGRKHAEMERLAHVQQSNAEAPQTGHAAHPQSNPALGATSGLSSASTTAASEELLESVFAEAPAPPGVGVPNSSVSSNTELNIPEKTDLWSSCTDISLYCKCVCLAYLKTWLIISGWRRCHDTLNSLQTRFPE